MQLLSVLPLHVPTYVPPVELDSVPPEMVDLETVALETVPPVIVAPVLVVVPDSVEPLRVIPLVLPERLLTLPVAELNAPENFESPDMVNFVALQEPSPLTRNG